MRISHRPGGLCHKPAGDFALASPRSSMLDDHATACELCSWRRTSRWRGWARWNPDGGSAGPRLPPENPGQELTNSDQEEQVSDRAGAAQGLLATSDDMPGVTTVGNKGSSVRIRPSRHRSEAIRDLPDGLFRSCTAVKYSNGSLIEALTELPQGFPGGLG